MSVAEGGAGEVPRRSRRSLPSTTPMQNRCLWPAAPAPALAPATRQHAALPPPARSKPTVPAAVAATSSTPQADKDALENVIELVRKQKPGDATQLQATISDPVARKLAEWLILRSDDNGASVERYRAFLAANPSWPSQTFLRRRIEAALWDDHREDSAVWSWFENESPVSAKGRFALAKVMIGRGDRANAERLVREAWRSDPMSEDTETAALDQFGALFTAGDHKARMDTMLYNSEQEAAGLRAAKRLGAGYLALAKARLAANKKAANLRALLEAVPRELHGDTGYLFCKDPAAPPRGEIRRSRAADDERAEGCGKALQCRRMVDRAATVGAQDDRRRRVPHRLSDCARRRVAGQGHLQDRTGVHRGLDRAALPQRSGGRVPAFRPHRRRQRQPDSACPRRLLAGPRRGSRRPCAGGARRLYPRRRAIDQLLRPVGARKTRLAADRFEWRPARPRRRAARDRACGRSCSTSSTSARSRSRFSPTWARMAIPMRSPGSANSPRATATPAACC